jgi:death-on-curing protein
MRYLTLGEVVDLHRAVIETTGVDGNKRLGHAAAETFLILNGSEIDAPVDEQERLMLDLASGRLTREQLAAWLFAHLRHAG